MRRPKFRLALCAAGLAAALAGGALALGNGDSLISLSYLTDYISPQRPEPAGGDSERRHAGGL